MDKDVLLSIPDESIVPYSLESMVSAICVAGTYEGNNKFKLTVCVTVILKVLAQVEFLIPSYGFCPIPPCEEFAENVCDEFFSLPLFPQQNGACTTAAASSPYNCSSCASSGCGCTTSTCSNCGTACAGSCSQCPRCGRTMTLST